MVSDRKMKKLQKLEKGRQSGKLDQEKKERSGLCAEREIAHIKRFH